MILDKFMQFDAAATAASGIVTGTVASTNILDLLNARDLAISGADDLVVVFTITTAFAATGGAASLRIEFQGAADNGAGSPGTYYTLSKTDDIPKANLTAGTVLRLPYGYTSANPQLTSLPRFVRCLYSAVTNSFTSGAFECDLVVNPQANNPPVYASGFTVAN